MVIYIYIYIRVHFHDTVYPFFMVNHHDLYSKYIKPFYIPSMIFQYIQPILVNQWLFREFAKNQRLFWSLNHLENWELGNPRFQKMPRTKTGSMYRSSTYQPHLIGFIDNLAIKQWCFVKQIWISLKSPLKNWSSFFVEHLRSEGFFTQRIPRFVNHGQMFLASSHQESWDLGILRYLEIPGPVNVYSLRTWSHGPVVVKVNFPMKNGGSFHSCVELPEGTLKEIQCDNKRHHMETCRLLVSGSNQDEE